MRRRDGKPIALPHVLEGTTKDTLAAMDVTPSGGSPTKRPFVMPQPGDVVAGKYTVVRVVGEGGMGIVYEATHQRLRQRVALKMLLPSMLENEVFVSRFEREARAAAQLRGRHCARVMDVDVTADGLPYIVMDFLKGHDLQIEIERRGWLPIAEAVDYVLQACAAMVEAHQVGIIHRDLKPSNLFLERESDGADVYVVKVLDFGISKVGDDADSRLTDADAVMGTALYMSPEQVKASRTVDARADIWALGVILYEALSGRVPWTGSTPQVAAMIVTEDAPDLQSFRQVPPGLAAIVHRCLQRDPNERFQDVKALASALAPFALPGSAGRMFADNIVPSGSSPRLAMASRPIVSPSLPPGLERTDENARTILNARGVSEEVMGEEMMSEEVVRTRETGTAPGWSQHPPASSRSRALVALLVAFVLGVVTIGSVALYLRRPKHAAEPVVSERAKPSPVATTSTSTLAADAPSVEPEAVPSTTASAPLPSPPSTSAAPVVRSAARPSSASPPSRKPAAPPKTTASTPDKPLFL